MKEIAVKIAQALMLILAVICFNFTLVHLAPGDAVSALTGLQGGANAEDVARLRAQYGLDEPLPTQLVKYVGNVLQGDFGYSITKNRPVTELILARIWPTVLLAFSALGFAILVGTTIGTIAARRPDGWFSNIITVGALVGFSMPVFWTGIILLRVFGVDLGWLPIGGMHDLRMPRDASWMERQLDVLTHLLLPAFSLGLLFLASYSRLSRASMLEVLQSDYVRTARAKGLSEKQVLFKHALRNGIIPIVTVIGLELGVVLSGAILVETVFNWPGVAQLAFQAVTQRDTNVLLGVLTMVSATVVVVNLLTDIVYRLIDPRIRVQENKNG